jgi:hypothetical protein
VTLGSLLVVGEGILFGDDGRWSEPLTTLLRSAQSRVSSGAPLDVACEDTLASPFTEYFVYAWEAWARSPVCGDVAIVRA